MENSNPTANQTTRQCTTVYINNHSNHPPSILKQLQSAINKRISKLSCDQETFAAASPLVSMKTQSYVAIATQTSITWTTTTQPTKAMHRRTARKDPPYSKNVKTNIERNFLNLVDKYFPKSSRFHKIFIRNTLKVSYSCINNIKNTMHKRNHHILGKERNQQPNKTARKRTNALSPEIVWRRTSSTKPKSLWQRMTK